VEARQAGRWGPVDGQTDGRSIGEGQNDGQQKKSGFQLTLVRKIFILNTVVQQKNLKFRYMALFLKLFPDFSQWIVLTFVIFVLLPEKICRYQKL
jgi:hypothetical protein